MPGVLSPQAEFGLRWLMSEKIGRVESDMKNGKRRYRLIFPGYRAIYSVNVGEHRMGLTKELADRVLRSIRSDYANGIRLEAAIERFVQASAKPENAVKVRWKAFCADRRARRHRKAIGDQRLYDLERMVDRGYLDWWEESGYSALRVSTETVDAWATWLCVRFPDHKPKTRHNIVNDFLTFAGWLKAKRDIAEAPAKPDLPPVDITAPEVPAQNALERYLAAIPEEIRGLWLTRSIDGLRPKEARLLRIWNYDWDTQQLNITETKTMRGRRSFTVDWELAEWLEKWVPPADRLDPMRRLFRNPKSFLPAQVASVRAKARQRGKPEPVIDGTWTNQAERDVHLRAIEAAELPYFKPNIIGRHAAATHQLARSKENTGAWDKEAVRKKLGHTDSKTTERYIDARVIEVGSVARMPRKEPR
jgi:integrase